VSKLTVSRMPLYDFSCRSCGTKFEARAAVDEAAACSQCGAPAERVPSSFAAPRSPALGGLAARRSNAQRATREEQRRERREQRRRDS
jgi:putative FmdB family regulatory protein